jgi:hypothetical protein
VTISRGEPCSVVLVRYKRPLHAYFSLLNFTHAAEAIVRHRSASLIGNITVMLEHCVLTLEDLKDDFAHGCSCIEVIVFV